MSGECDFCGEHTLDCKCKKKLKITCIADLHGHYPELPGGDLLIFAGDLTRTDEVDEYLDFYEWLDSQDYRKTILIAGNHDKNLADEKYQGRDDRFYPAIYLCDSGTEFEGLKIWGSPYTPEFMNWAFMLTPEQDKTHWDRIPEDTDILITHGPPYGIMDKNSDGEQCGSIYLRNRSMIISPKIHVFGHIHECNGVVDTVMTKFINCSMVDEHYRPGRLPITVEI